MQGWCLSKPCDGEEMERYRRGDGREEQTDDLQKKKAAYNRSQASRSGITRSHMGPYPGPTVTSDTVKQQTVAG